MVGSSLTLTPTYQIAKEIGIT